MEAAPASPGAGTTAGAAAAAENPSDRKAQRRERAQRRGELRTRTAPLRKTIRDAEARIAELEQERAGLVTELETPGRTDYSAISRRLSEIEDELPRQLEAWEAASRDMESIGPE
jgi:ATP-binding cassette subfamily F protein 3